MNINDKQRNVIEELNNNILLLASAGTGKTNTLALRISNIINSGKGLGSEILCITFTNKACREMKERIQFTLGQQSKDITVKTFHSFCYDIVKENAKKRTDVFSDFIVFDEDDSNELISIITNNAYPIMAIQRFIETIKLERAKRNFYSEDVSQDYDNALNNLIYSNKLIELSTIRGNLDSSLLNFLKEDGKNFILKYDELLHDNHGLDFTDLIVKTKELFTDESLVDSISQRFKYINIDEVQDTSILEYEIIEKLFKNNKILMCGDIFQTIYGWRGSNPNTIFDNYKSNYNPVEIVFDKNYRATKNLTNASLSYLNNAFPSQVSNLYKEDITAETNNTGSNVIFKDADSRREEAKYIFEEIKELQLNKEDISNVCILTRDNKYNIELSDYFRDITDREAVSFDFVLVDQFKFFRRQEIKDVIAFLKLIGNRYDSLSLKRIVKRLPTGVGDRTLEAIGSDEYKKSGITLTDYIDPLVQSGGEKYSLLINEFSNDNIVVFDVESTGIDVTEDEIIQIAAIKINRRGEVIETFERFLKNVKPVGNSYFVHGFSDEKLSEIGEDKSIVLNDFLNFSRDSVIVGHNVQYDLNILNSELSRLNLPSPSYKAFYDTLDIYRRFYPNLKNHKLETLSNIFKTNHKPSHDAMDDIIATGELLTRAIEENIIPTSLERISLMTKHIKSFQFISSKLNSLFDKAKTLRPKDIVVEIINSFNIKSIYNGDSGKEKISRLRDFYVLLRDLDDENKSNRDALLDVIKLTSLSNGDLESLIINRTKKPRIPIITVHQAKGLEFDTVFLAGAQNNVFPSYMALKSKNLEEEKRTFYVAITRAKKLLYITYSKYDNYHRLNSKSCFIDYISHQYIDEKRNK